MDVRQVPAATVALACVLCLVAGCSKKEESNLDPVGATDPIPLTVRLMEYDTTVDDSLVLDLSTMATVTVDGVKAVPFPELITTTLITPYDNRTPDDTTDDIDRRPLYAYRVIGADGYSAHESRGEPDNRWEHMALGGISTAELQAVFDPGLGLSRRYNVDNVAAIEIYRMVDVVHDTDTVMVELAEQTTVDLGGDSVAVELTEIVAVLASPQTYRYTLTAVDGYSGISPIAYDTLQTGYWLLAQDHTLFVPDLGGPSRIRHVQRIEATVD
ncbi:MAG: hypothetical protein GF331_03025 [Chitinivibrionales bacterium]|nr:hypothetical protein [Chitinivibrionales bacterium]